MVWGWEGDGGVLLIIMEGEKEEEEVDVCRKGTVSVCLPVSLSIHLSFLIHPALYSLCVSLFSRDPALSSSTISFCWFLFSQTLSLRLFCLFHFSSFTRKSLFLPTCTSPGPLLLFIPSLFPLSPSFTPSFPSYHHRLYKEKGGSEGGAFHLSVTEQSELLNLERHHNLQLKNQNASILLGCCLTVCWMISSGF